MKIKAVLLGFFWLFSLSANAVLIEPNQALRIDFSLTGIPAQSIDLFVFEFRSMNFDGSGFQQTSNFEASLLNGDTVLGTDYTNLVPSETERRRFAFSSAGSIATFDDPAQIDFSSILDGSIAGSILIRSSESYDINMGNLYSNFEFNFLESISWDSAVVNNANYAYPISASVVSLVEVDEPSHLSLMFVGLLLLSVSLKKATSNKSFKRSALRAPA